ncbi:uncharacterized protein LOC118279847 [Spodoptera frugiperda]|uniref:SFRICE_009575 n=1 Tax=Spodoptera frugiperda TaxID=7108 RepID=A0A2H1WWJ1_SPOFR|nr:uncharacterized protein LOC118279847 [Spodoptera frugiperda]
MPIDPFTAFLLGTCCCICWPCLLPLCLSLPVIPLPMIIIRQQDFGPNAQAAQNGQCVQSRRQQQFQANGYFNGLRSSLRYFPFEGFDGRRYNVVVDSNTNDFIFQKTT